MAINTVKQDEKSTKTSKLKTILRLFRYLLPYKGATIAVLCVIFVIVAITLINPLIIEKAINVYIKQKDTRGLIRVGILAAALNVIMIILIRIRLMMMVKLSNNILLTIRQELYEHIQGLSFNFFDSIPTGKILARIMSDVNSLKDVLSNGVTTLIPDFVTIVAVVVIMFIKNRPLAIASLISLPLMIVGVGFVQAKAHVRWQIHKKKNSNLNAFIHEDVSGMKVVQSFNAEGEAKQDFTRLLKEHRGSFMDAVRYADAFGSVVDFCWAIGIIALFYTGLKLAGPDKIPEGTLLAFIAYISMFWSPISNLSGFFNSLITNIAGAERVFEVLDTKPEITDVSEAEELPEIKGDVEFKNVTFSYDKETNVLNNVSFKVNAGETIALVGPTGAGKTTIVNLISRFYDVNEGNIFIDDYDIKSVSMESLRKQLGIMMQDNFMFSGTIRDNIRYGRLDATDEEIEEAAKAVNAHEFIMKLEKGYDTEVKQGSGISIGQKQLIAFARTMVSQPKILILDEATSSIDTHTELMVQKGIASLLKNRTSFVVAHRLSTIQNADKIFVIDKGGIMEAGTAKELLEKKGIYYELYMAQFKNIA